MAVQHSDTEPSQSQQAEFIRPAVSTMECGAAIGSGEMRSFVEAFQQSARRWELVVYPALFAFIILAGYGFFLVYSLTGNMSKIANNFDPQMYQHMEVMTQHMVLLNQEMKTMTSTMVDISGKLDSLQPMEKNTRSMETSIRYMEKSIRVITLTTDQMRTDMGQMNRSVSRPLSFFNSISPW